MTDPHPWKTAIDRFWEPFLSVEAPGATDVAEAYGEGEECNDGCDHRAESFEERHAAATPRSVVSPACSNLAQRKVTVARASSDGGNLVLGQVRAL